MSQRISENIFHYIKHSRSYLFNRKNLAVGCAGLVAYRILSKLIEMSIDYSDRKRNIPNIRVLFRKPYEPGLIKAIDGVLDKAITDITFLGWRYIAVPSYRGRISMDEVANRIEWLSENVTDLSDNERRIGQAFEDKIFNLYRRGDEIIGRINSFSGALCAFRDTYFDPGCNEYGSAKWQGHSVFKKEINKVYTDRDSKIGFSAGLKAPAVESSTMGSVLN